jgi:outer membrane immunogenic protein
MAADMRMPVKAPPVVEPPFSWSGFYLGGNVGYSWGRATTDQTDTLTTTGIVRAFVASTGAETTTVTGFPQTFPVVGTPATTIAASSARYDVNGFVGGAQAGYNWQLDRYWLIGFETDIQGSGERGSVTGCTVAACTAGSLFQSSSTRLEWFGTARLRAGFLPVERVLLYATGGLAYGELRSDYSSGINAVGAPVATGSSRSVRLGYAVGGGIEGAIDRHWTVKGEYLFLGFDPFSTNLGSVTSTATGAGILVSDARFLLVPQTVSTASAVVRTRFYDNVFRVGANYKF